LPLDGGSSTWKLASEVEEVDEVDEVDEDPV
jgi:hypothetical protein